MSVRSRRFALVIAALAGTPATSAWAEPTSTERALAQTLFDEGRALLAAQRYREACAKFSKSQELDPSAGTFINLALCHESEGKLATAWAEFNEALSQALRDGRANREQSSREHIEKLRPQLDQLTVVVSDEAKKIPGFTVTLDGSVLREALWGTATPIDPGKHMLVASAPGREPWTTSVEFDSPALTRTVELPPLQKAAPTGTEASAGSGPLSRRTVGLIVGGVGAVSLVVGAFYGIRAFSKDSASDDECGAGGCTAKGLTLNREAQTSAWIANVAIGLGLVGVGVGGYLYLTAPPESAKGAMARRAYVAPVVGARGGGVAMGAVF